MIALKDLKYAVVLRFSNLNQKWYWLSMVKDFDNQNKCLNLNFGISSVTFHSSEWSKAKIEAADNWKEFAALNGWSNWEWAEDYDLGPKTEMQTELF